MPTRPGLDNGGAATVQSLGYQFFPCPTFSRDEDSRLNIGQSFYKRIDLLHLLAFAYDAMKLPMFFELPFEVGDMQGNVIELKSFHAGILLAARGALPLRE